VNQLQLRHVSGRRLSSLLAEVADTPFRFSDEQRDALAARFRAVPTTQHRRLDAWSVEQGGAEPTPFAWSPSNARRSLGRSALAAVHVGRSPSLAVAVRQEIERVSDRALSPSIPSGSLAVWLVHQRPAVRAIVAAEAVTWATETLECFDDLLVDWEALGSDAYYDVAGARTSLRGRREALVNAPTGRVLVRVRSGAPGASAGAGLRADLVTDALANPLGVAALRIVGLWPDAGIALAVDGTEGNVKRGARGLVRAASVRQGATTQRRAS